MPQEPQRRFLKEVLRVIGLDSEPGAGVGQELGPLFGVEQYGLHDFAVTRVGFRFHLSLIPL